MSETLVNQIDNKNIYASRAVADEDGTNIKTSYALKSEIPYVPASTSADENKVLTVASDGTPGWAASQGLFIAQYGSTSYADIDAAVRANKIVYCYVNSRFAFLAYTNTAGADHNYEFQYYRSASSGKDSIFIYKVRPAVNPYGPEWETTERQVKAANTVPTVSSNDDGKVLKATYSGGVGSYSWQAVAGSVTYTTLTAAPTGSAINDIFEGLLNSVSNGRGFAIGIIEGTTKTTWLWPTSVTNSSATTGTAVFSGSVQKTVDGVVYTEIKTLTITAESTPSSSTFVLKSAAALPNIEWNPWSTLPANTIRCKFSSGYTPTMGDTQTLVDSGENIWDIYKSSDNWNSLFRDVTELLEVVAANVSDVTSMWETFSGCTSLVSVAPLSLDSVNSTYDAFLRCTSLVSASVNAPSATNMARTFLHCTSLVSASVNAPSATDMGQFFQGCTLLSSVQVTTGSVLEDASSMFYDCTSLVTAPEFTTSGITDASNLYCGCSSLRNVPAYDLHSVVNASSMFLGCTSLESVSAFNLVSATKLTYMFYNSGLKEIPMLSTDSATEVYNMFYDCYNVESGALAIYNQMANQANPPSSHSLCFYNCGRDAPVDAPIHAEMLQIPSSWK